MTPSSYNQINIGGISMSIPNYFDFRKSGSPTSSYIYCSILDRRNGNSENFAVSYMDSNSQVVDRIKIHIEKLERCYSMNSSPLHSIGYDPYAQMQQEVGNISNQIKSIKKQNNKLLLLT